MIIGVPKEIAKDENRVGLVPANVKSLIRQGDKVFIEKGAGLGIGITDNEYKKAGGNIIEKIEVLYEKSDIIVKIMEPMPSEYEYFKKGQILFSMLHLAVNEKLTNFLLENQITSIGYETIEEESGYLPVLAPMSEIAGRMAIQLGAYFLQNNKGGRGTLLGGVPGVKKGTVTVIGTGVAGQNAIQMALGIGANVIALDVNMKKLRELDNRYKGQVQTMFSNTLNIEEALFQSHVVVGAALIPGGKTPKLIKKHYLSQMKKGSVIVDLSVDQGGITETIKPTTFENPIYKIDNVIHYGVPNIPGAVARTSTFALTNITIPYIKEVARLGFKEAVNLYPDLKKGVNTHNRHLTHKTVAESLNRKYYQLKL
jgi:alanine dehydrogenase